MNRFHITNYKLFDPRVKDDFRILVLSDVHFNHFTKQRTLDSILKEVKSLMPNYIFIPGDLLDFSDIFYENKFLNIKMWLKSLGSIAPVFISLGNHELYALDEEIKNNENFISLYNN